MTDYKKNRKRLSTVTVSPDQMGKLPPQAVDLEEVVLGAMLLEREAVEQVIAILEPSSFYKEQNGLIFEAITKLYKQSQPVDILTVTKELQRTGNLEMVGGPYYISTLTNRVASSANIEIHARVVLEKALARDLIRISTSGIQKAYEDGTDVFDLFSQQSLSLDNCLESVTKQDIKLVGDIHTDLIIDHLDIIKSGKPSGVPIIFRNLAKFTNGWQPGNLIILAGRPSMGKSLVAGALAAGPAIELNIPTAFFSLEMSKGEVVSRIQSDMSEIDASRIAKKQLDKDEVSYINSVCDKLYKAPLYIDDTPNLSLIDFKHKARKLVTKKGVKLIIIDYLQLMSVSDDYSGSREQEISTISRTLKGLAKELNIPIIALSQLNRSVETRDRSGDKKPMLSDLRESGAIEQDADMVIFVYRPLYYGIQEYEYANQMFDSVDFLSLIFAKHRGGALGEVFLGVKLEFSKIINYDFQNKRPEWTPNKKPWEQNNVTQTNNNLEISKENNTFVQPLNKMQENTDFLNQKSGTDEFDDIPF